MIVVLLKIMVPILNFIYLFYKLLPTQNKIVMISRQSNKINKDFSLIGKNLEKEYKVVYLCKTLDGGVNSKISTRIKYGLHMFTQMYHLATSKVCITDGYNITISVLKHKKKLKIIQIWHSMIAIKNFGHQSLNTTKKKKIAKILKMHNNYDYITCSSEAMIKIFKKCFNYDESYFYPIGLPRIDYLINENKTNKNKVYQSYPEFKKKKVILYAPTFRENNNYKINELINAVDFKKYILIIKLHNNTNYVIEDKLGVYTCSEFSTLQLLSVTQYLITDYSGVLLEASALNIPIYIYAYDLKEYSKMPGINIDLNKEFPGYVFNKAKKLFDNLDKEKYDMDIVKKFKKKYIINSNGTITKNLVEFIIERGLEK